MRGIGEPIRYIDGHWEAVTRFFESGRLNRDGDDLTEVDDVLGRPELYGYD